MGLYRKLSGRLARQRALKGVHAARRGLGSGGKGTENSLPRTAISYHLFTGTETYPVYSCYL
jgi:hypothetical protein